MDCRREGCSNAVPQGRRKYCSEECAAIVNKAAAAARSARYYRMMMRSRKPKLTPRNCLRCGNTFESEGPWNRICTECHEANDTLSSRSHAYAVMSTGDPAELKAEGEDGLRQKL